MSALRRTRKALAALLPLGAFGISVALAAAPGKSIDQTAAAETPRPSVATRLATIRTAVSQVTADQAGLQPGDPNILKAWWRDWPTDALVMSKRPVIETIVVQPTPLCNIDCNYCYLPNRRDHSTMSQDTLRTLFERVFASGWSASSITVIWHAGEPLVLPPSYYRSAFDLIRIREC
jgi:sulfatase maturation enzyme AslB (radical SAM superfamily)